MVLPGAKGKDIRKGKIRWAMLFMACCFLLGSYYCYDIPGVIQDETESLFNVNDQGALMLYSVYSYPNMVLPIFGGIFLDKIGIRPGLLLFTTILTIG